MSGEPSGTPIPDGDDLSALSFPDVPRLELDQLLGQLVDRAQEVMGTQGRLRSLLRANRTIRGLERPDILQHAVPRPASSWEPNTPRSASPGRPADWPSSCTWGWRRTTSAGSGPAAGQGPARRGARRPRSRPAGAAGRRSAHGGSAVRAPPDGRLPRRSDPGSRRGVRRVLPDQPDARRVHRRGPGAARRVRRLGRRRHRPRAVVRGLPGSRRMAGGLGGGHPTAAVGGSGRRPRSAAPDRRADPADRRRRPGARPPARATPTPTS